MEQTAVEWFFEQLTEVDYGCINKTFLQNNNSLAGHKLRELFEQAKAMEKKQLFLAANTSAKQAYKAGQKSMYCGCYEISGCTSYEDWLYEKTFKSE